MHDARTILLVSYPPHPLTGLEQELSAAGYHVQVVGSMSAALGAVGPGTLPAVIFAPNVPPGDRRRVEGEAKRRNGAIKIILLYQGEREKDVFASAILDIAAGTPSIVQTLGTLLAS